MVRNKIHPNIGRGNFTMAGFALVAGAALCFAVAPSASAQQTGPLRPPPVQPGTVTPTTPSSTNGTGGSGTGTKSSSTERPPSNMPQLPPPTIPVEEIIRKFGERESAFKEARDNYTYRQTVVVKDFGPAGEEGGEYRLVSDVTFTPEGRRYEDVKFAPPPSLQYMQLTPEDMADLRNIQPFVLTTEELPKYDVKYVGHEPLDQLTAYLFDVSPKKMEKGKRYFEGRIWVDDKDLEIVKSYGKAVPDTKDNVAPHFETIRENIAGNYWFPTYTHADDVLHFTTGGKHSMVVQDNRIIMTVRYENYKYFGSKVKIGPVKQEKPDEEELPDPPQF